MIPSSDASNYAEVRCNRVVPEYSTVELNCVIILLLLYCIQIDGALTVVELTLMWNTNPHVRLSCGVSFRQPPPQNHRLLVMATTSVPYLLEDLMLPQAFMVSLHVPLLQGGESVKTVLRKLVPMSEVSE